MRRSITLASALGLTLALAACSGDSDSNDDPSSSPSTSSGSGSNTTLTVWVDETRAPVLEQVAKDFEDANEGVTVNLVQKNYDDLRPDFLAQVPTGEGPDITVGAHDWLGDLQANGVIAPIELADKADDFAEVAIQAYTFDGQIYGLPYAIESIGLVRNNALATETPDTFDALIEQGKASGAQYPVLLQVGEEGDAYHLYPLQTSFGASIFALNEDGSYNTEELNLGGDAGASFANYIAKLGSDGVLNTSITSDIAKQSFIEGKSPYIVTGAWNIADFQEAGLDVTVLPVPSAGGQPSQPFVGVPGFYLSAKSENALLANQFLVNYLATPEVQVKLYEVGQRTPALTEAADQVQDDTIVAGFGESAAAGAAMPSIPEMNALWSFWGTAEARIISGAATDPVAEWNTAVTNMQGALGGS